MLIHDVLLDILFINGYLVCLAARDSLTCELPTYIGAADCRVALQAAGCVSGAFACYVNATPSSSRPFAGPSPQALVLTNHGMYSDIHSHFISAGHLPPADPVAHERSVNGGDGNVSREAAIESLLSYFSHFPARARTDSHTDLYIYMASCFFIRSHVSEGLAATEFLVVEMKTFVP